MGGVELHVRSMGLGAVRLRHRADTVTSENHLLVKVAGGANRYYAGMAMREKP